VTSIAMKVGLSSEALRGWVRQAERDTGRQPGPTTADLRRMEDLEREVKDVSLANHLLRQASACLAAAALDCRPR
jgi:transposase-like protein